MTKFAFVLLGVALALATSSARGDGRRIALLHGDPELQRALSLALSAWDVETVPFDLQLSEGSDWEVRVEAARLARNVSVDAIVWVSSTARGSRLAVYDALTGELIVRDLPELPPFASTTAAALALSVKTALRPSVEQESGQRSDLPARKPRALVPSPAPAEVSASPGVRASFRALANVTWVEAGKPEARWGLGGTRWFDASHRWGAGLALSSGLGVDFDTAGVVGRYRDWTVGIGGEWRWLEAGAVSSSFGLGAGLRAATLDGTLSDNRRLAFTRYNPSLDAAVRLDVRFAGTWFVGLDVSSCFFVRYQRFLLAGRTVFAPYRLSPSAGASLGIEIF